MTERDYGGILPCGGRGKRFIELSGDVVPKSLFKVGGKELIKYSIEALSPEIVTRLVFAVDYKADEIKKWVHEAQLPHVVHFSEQTEPGVLGSIVAGADYIQEESMVACNTDEVRLGLSLINVIRFHEARRTLATMVATYTNHLYRHRVVEARENDHIVVETRLKPQEYKNHPERIGLVNTGFLIIEKQALRYFDPGYSRDWGGIIDPLCDAGQLSVYIDPEIHYFNIGTLEEYQEAEEYLEQDS